MFMHYLHKMHEVNTKVAGPVPLYVLSLKLLNRF